MPDSSVRIELSDRIAIVTFHRPQRSNTFNATMWSQLDRAVSQLEQDRPRAVILTGAGDKAFSAGFDVNPDNPQVAGLLEAFEKGQTEPIAELLKTIRRIVDGLFALPVPIIAAINGKAFGGGAELAVRCDLRVMDPRAVICFSEVRLGLMPDWGGTATLSRLVGPMRAADLILTAREIDAAEADDLGLVTRLSEAGKSLDTALQLAQAIARNGPRAVAAALEVIRAGQSMGLKETLELEMARAIALIASGECVQGITAFLAKQKPKFSSP